MHNYPTILRENPLILCTCGHAIVVHRARDPHECHWPGCACQSFNHSDLSTQELPDIPPIDNF